jgi:hypothetical protein
MQAASQIKQRIRPQSDPSPLPGIAVMGVTAGVAVILLLVLTGAFESYPYLYLMPWLLGLAAVMIAPNLYLYYKGQFSFANPIVFATFSYFFPAFVIGGIFFAGGWSQPYFVQLIQDADYNLPLTVVLVGIAFIGLTAGYMLPIGRKVGVFISDRLPLADYQPRSFITPGLILLGLGVMNTVMAFALGLFGYQKGDEINSYDGLVYLTTLFWLQASFLLWLVIFRQKTFKVTFIPVIALLVVTSLSKAIFAGNRGSIVQIFSVVVLAYILSGRKFGLRQGAIAGVILIVGLMIGMIYGTTFRAVKGTEAQQSAGQYAENVLNTFDQVGRNDTWSSIEFAFSSITERVDILSTLAVVVSNYEQLAPYEEAYGIDNNIWVEATTFFIPRVIWTEKPTVSDPRRFSDLYFNFGESSFGITAVGDLLRNFGIIGVPLGMLLLGLILRVIYVALIEGRPSIIWRQTVYFMLLATLSYEGFYSTIIPGLFKVGVTAVVGILIVSLIAKRSDRSAASPA